jgi:hypothetical protein
MGAVLIEGQRSGQVRTDIEIGEMVVPKTKCGGASATSSSRGLPQGTAPAARRK